MPWPVSQTVRYAIGSAVHVDVDQHGDIYTGERTNAGLDVRASTRADRPRFRSPTAQRSMLTSARRSVSAPAMLRHFRPRTPRRPLAGLRLSQRVAASRDIATRNRKIAA